jgi:hypothetical protein
MSLENIGSKFNYLIPWPDPTWIWQRQINMCLFMSTNMACAIGPSVNKIT